MSLQKLLTIDELCSILNIKKSTLYAWIHYKKIPFVKLGSRVAFLEEQINDFIMKNNYIPES